MIVRTLLSAAMSLCFLSTPVLTQNSYATEAKVVTQVGSVPVTIFDLGREQQRILPFNSSFHSGISKETREKMNKEALNTLIDQAYKVNYAIDQKLTIDKKLVDERIEKLKKNYKTDKEFKSALGEESVKDLRAAIERTLLAQKAETFAVTSKIKISDADLRAYYDTNKQMYNRPKQYKASHILIKVNPSSNDQERTILENKAKELSKKAKSGEDFYNLAYYNSDDRSKYVGGDLGLFHEGQTLPEFEGALKKMKPGEVSDPIKSMYGWHIIKLVELNEAQQLSYEDSKVKIREYLEKTAKEKLFNSWMADLKSKYTVKNN